MEFEKVIFFFFLHQNANLLKFQIFCLFIQCLNSWSTTPCNDVCTGNYIHVQQNTAKIVKNSFIYKF